MRMESYYICTDKNRKNFRYRNGDNEEIYDPSATNLIKQIKEYAKDAIYTRTIEVIESREREVDDPFDRIIEMNNATI